MFHPREVLVKFVSPGMALGALLLLGVGSAPAAAQKACVQCDSAEMRRSFDDAVRQLRSTVQALRARKSDTAMVRALRETDSVLRAFDPAQARASHDLARAQRRLIESDDERRDVALQRLVRELEPINASAARSLEEGLDETLTLHRLRVPEELRTSLHTTNLIESVMACLERHTRRVTHWRTSDQKQRWVAATLLKVEGQFRRVRGFKHLPLLHAALTTTLHPTTVAA